MAPAALVQAVRSRRRSDVEAAAAVLSGGGASARVECESEVWRSALEFDELEPAVVAACRQSAALRDATLLWLHVGGGGSGGGGTKAGEPALVVAVVDGERGATGLYVSEGRRCAGRPVFRRHTSGHARGASDAAAAARRRKRRLLAELLGGDAADGAAVDCGDDDEAPRLYFSSARGTWVIGKASWVGASDAALWFSPAPADGGAQG